MKSYRKKTMTSAYGNQNPVLGQININSRLIIVSYVVVVLDESPEISFIYFSVIVN
jgi:hypothetical protein